ncbi:MAG: putative 4-mercaptohistidine N1-methyltransferase [Chthoniobacteraceae bacterium]
MSIYESDKLLGEYLLFHYGSADEVAPPAGAEHALDFAVRCVGDCAGTRALDVGCAVGRSTFELARVCESVIGIDYSRRFIDAAETIRRDGSLGYERTDEGTQTTRLVARRPEVDPSRVSFEVGDAMALRDDLGEFDLVLAANLIDRLADPARFLARLPALVKPGGQLVITSPYTWLEDFTPREKWLGGFHGTSTLDGLHSALGAAFELATVRDLPFLIREHARKFQLSVAQATIWRRRTFLIR